jgi:hypothetical protein
MGKKVEAEIIIEKMTVGKAQFTIIGMMPMIYNCMSSKAKHELLYPKGRKTSADKAQNMKHNPIEEYRGSVYRMIGDDGETRLGFPAAAVKSAICNAALEIPGAKKAQIGRLVWVEGDMLPVFGKPKMLMSVVRSADMNKTPDIRTRAIIPEWCMKFTVNFVEPTMNVTTVARLIETAGLVIGLGDFRQEKGKGNYGQCRLSDADEVKAILQNGIKVQDAALESPEFYDVETQELYTWFESEKKTRGR